MTFTPRIVSEPFLQKILNEYPILKTNGNLRSLTEFLLFSTYKDERSGKLLLPSKTIAELIGKNYDKRNFALIHLLRAFKQEVNPTLAWSNWKSVSFGTYGIWKNVDRRVRVVTNLVWSDTVIRALYLELRLYWKDKPRVYFSTGTQWTRQKEKERIEQQRQKAVEFMANAKVSEAKELLELMNTASSLPFHKIMDNLNDTIKLANNLAHDESEREEMTRQLKILNAIYSQQQPFYKPTKASTRIFSIGEGLPYLDRRLRHELTKGWIECDLASAQLAIGAKLWNVPEVEHFLKDGGNIWDHLFEQYGLQKDEETKQLFKTALYAMMYGMRRTTKQIDQDSLMNILEPIGGKQFFKSPLIKAMYQARKKQLDLITKHEGAMNCFDQWLPLKITPWDTEGFSKRSILAQLSQAYELKLLFPMVRLAREHKDDKNGFAITLWQHDGFSYVAHKSARTDYWKKRIEILVNMQAKHLGIHTHFETKS